jgi:hypothetical protein
LEQIGRGRLAILVARFHMSRALVLTVAQRDGMQRDDSDAISTGGLD